MKNVKFREFAECPRDMIAEKTRKSWFELGHEYLGHILSADDWDDAAVSYNITKANQAWWSVYLILRCDSTNSHTIAWFYLAVVWAKLLFGSETWVLIKQVYSW